MIAQEEPPKASAGLYLRYIIFGTGIQLQVSATYGFGEQGQTSEGQTYSRAIFTS